MNKQHIFPYSRENWMVVIDKINLIVGGGRGAILPPGYNFLYAPDQNMKGEYTNVPSIPIKTCKNINFPIQTRKDSREFLRAVAPL